MKACIDIGGTKVAVSLNSGAGLELIARRSEPTVKSGDNGALARQIVRMVDAACAEAGVEPHTVRRAGVSSCGPFVLRAGLVELAARHPGGLVGHHQLVRVQPDGVEAGLVDHGVQQEQAQQTEQAKAGKSV